MDVDQPINDVVSSNNNNDDDDDPISFLSTLPEPLRGYSIKAFYPPPNDNNNEVDDAAKVAETSNKLDELEISTRSHLLVLVEQLVSSCCSNINEDNNNEQQTLSSSSSAAIETLLQYLKNVTLLCLHISKHQQTSFNYLSSNISSLKKLPFVLLEDTIDSLPLQHIQILWSSSQYSTLNISSYTTTLLCSPYLFIPASKLILLRICNKLLKILSNRDVDSNFAGSLMIMMAKVFPLSERSAVNVLGSFNVDNETLFENEIEFNEKKSSSNDNIGYEFYKTFWGVQRVFTDPQGTILSSRGGLTQVNASNAYNCFMKDVTSILVALESTPVPKSTTSTTMSKLDEETNDTASSVRHHKYLTSSQLLHLQLKDAQLRIHFLTQLLIILSYLTSPAVTLPTGITPTAGSDTVKLSTQIRATQLKQLSQIEKRTMQLLRSTTPPLGEDMLRCLQWMLKEREVIWRNWKRTKCIPALDKASGRPNDGVSGLAIKNALLAGKKRKADSLLEEDEEANGMMKKKVDDGIQISTLSQITSSTPTLKSFLDPYVEALDPENGIEGEYHPRNDKVYSWRALRLIARDKEDGQLNRFNKLRLRDGDFESLVRDMATEKGGEIGGTLPEDYYVDDEPDDVPDSSAESNNNKLDVEMDVASVGTPEEETLAKKEQMEEFERAAMEVEDDLLNEKEGDEEEKEKQQVEVKSEGETVDDKKAATTERKVKEKEDAKIKDAANETVLSNEKKEVKEEPKQSDVKKKEESKKPDVKDVKKEELKKPDMKELKKEEPKVSKAKEVKKEDVGKDDGKKTPAEPTKSNGSKKDGKASVSQETGKKQDGNKKVDSKQPGRAKFTPPQKPQEGRHRNYEESNNRDSSRGRHGDRRGSERNDQQSDRKDRDHRRDNSSDGRRNQQPQHNRSQSRDGRDMNKSSHGGSNDNGRDSGKGRDTRDSRSRSPPKDSQSGKGNDHRGGGNVGGDRGRGGWVPPGRGGPSIRGRGGGGRGGGRGSRR